MLTHIFLALHLTQSLLICLGHRLFFFFIFFFVVYALNRIFQTLVWWWLFLVPALSTLVAERNEN